MCLTFAVCAMKTDLPKIHNFSWNILIETLKDYSVHIDSL